MQENDEPCGKCEGCPIFEVLERYSPSYANWVGTLLQGIARIKLDPTLARLYTLREKDLMILIQSHEQEKAGEEADRKWRTNNIA